MGCPKRVTAPQKTIPMPNLEVGDWTDIFIQANIHAAHEQRGGVEDPVYQQIAGIMDRCKQIEENIIEKAYVLLVVKKKILVDKEDIRRAVSYAMIEEWDRDNIYSRVPHFKTLFRYLGTPGCNKTP